MLRAAIFGPDKHRPGTDAEDAEGKHHQSVAPHMETDDAQYLSPWRQHPAEGEVPSGHQIPVGLQRRVSQLPARGYPEGNHPAPCLQKIYEWIQV